MGVFSVRFLSDVVVVGGDTRAATSLPASTMSDDQLIESFVAVTNTSKSLAEQYLLRNDGDLLAAIEDFYASETSGLATPQPSTRSGKSGGVRTFRDLNEDDEEDKTDTNFFTGGEKSALQVENPNKKGNDDQKQPSLIERIFQRAREQMDEPDDRQLADAPEPTVSSFTGTGVKLGDSSLPLETIADAHSGLRRPAKVSREITFWRQGFTVGDGELRRYDDPENQHVLLELKQGRVPVSVLDVEYGQDVDVSVVRKTEEDYNPPKRNLAGFHGLGQRLGSPVPGEESGTPEVSEAPAATVEEPKKPDVGSGDSLVQIRFASGKRTSHKFNGLDPVTAVYDFVQTHELNTSPERDFVLTHAFPVAPIEKADTVTVEAAKLKNAVVVQRWK